LHNKNDPGIIKKIKNEENNSDTYDLAEENNVKITLEEFNNNFRCNPCRAISYNCMTISIFFSQNKIRKVQKFCAKRDMIKIQNCMPIIFFSYPKNTIFAYLIRRK